MTVRPMLLLVLTFSTACGTRPARESSQQTSPPSASEPAADLVGRGAIGTGAASQSGTPSTPIPIAADTVAPQMLIRTGDASIEVDSLELAVAAVRRLASQAGGWVANTSFTGGRNQMREATLQLRIPSARFDDAQRGLDAIGTVEWMNVTAQDVGEEYVDLTARMTNSRRLEARLIELLARRTGKLEDVLAVERELARVREEIERSEGRLRFLRTRVSTSTLAVRVHEPAPVIAGTGSLGVLGESFRQAWRNFVSAIAALIASSGVLIPLLAVGVAGWFVVRKLRR